MGFGILIFVFWRYVLNYGWKEFDDGFDFRIFGILFEVFSYLCDEVVFYRVLF